jgi:hypothetical protein
MKPSIGVPPWLWKLPYRSARTIDVLVTASDNGTCMCQYRTWTLHPAGDSGYAHWGAHIIKIIRSWQLVTAKHGGKPVVFHGFHVISHRFKNMVSRFTSFISFLNKLTLSMACFLVSPWNTLDFSPVLQGCSPPVISWLINHGNCWYIHHKP